jgi:hypothetical protein
VVLLITTAYLLPIWIKKNCLLKAVFI